MSSADNGTRLAWTALSLALVCALVVAVLAPLLVFSSGTRNSSPGLDSSVRYSYDVASAAHDPPASLSVDTVSQPGSRTLDARPIPQTSEASPTSSTELLAPRGPLAPTRTTVNSIAERGGVGLDGVKVHILDPVADADTIRYLDMQGAVARTDDLGIQLHPGAFADEETLLRTLAHERTHVYQLQTFPNYGTGHMGAFESAAYGIEDSFWQYFLRGGQ